MSPSNDLWSWNERSIGWSRMGDADADLAVVLVHGQDDNGGPDRRDGVGGTCG